MSEIPDPSQEEEQKWQDVAGDHPVEVGATVNFGVINRVLNAIKGIFGGSDPED